MDLLMVLVALIPLRVKRAKLKIKIDLKQVKAAGVACATRPPLHQHYITDSFFQLFWVGIAYVT